MNLCTSALRDRFFGAGRLLATGTVLAAAMAATSCTSARTPIEPPRTAVLAEDFENGTATEGWSDRTVTTAPNGKTKYLGVFGPGTVTLSLNKLPKHAALRLSFTLHILGSWDGVGLWGPDRWRCGLKGGPVFLETTFNNCFLHWSDNIWQSYPEPYNQVQQDLFADMPARPPRLLACHGGSGASGIADLGFIWNKRPCSTSYTFSFVVPHSSTDATLEFTNLCDDPKNDQSFALDDVCVEALDTLPALSEADVERAWQILLTGSPAAALLAGSEFLAHPQELLRHCRELVKADPSRVKKLLERLDTGTTRSESLFADMEPGDDQARIAALRELTLMPGDLWTNRQQRDAFDATHPQLARTWQNWIYVMYEKGALSSTPLVRSAMRLAAWLRQNGTPEAAKMADAIEARVSSPGEKPAEE